MAHEVNVLYAMNHDNPGNVTIPLAVVKETDRAMSAALYSYLRFYAHPSSGQLIATRRELMELLGCKSTRPVDMAAADLQEKGFITRIQIFAKSSAHGIVPRNPAFHEYATEPGKGYQSLGHVYKILK
jgi:hypothetical protein